MLDAIDVANAWNVHRINRLFGVVFSDINNTSQQLVVGNNIDSCTSINIIIINHNNSDNNESR